MSIGADDPHDESNDYMRGLRRDEWISRIIVWSIVAAVASTIAWLAHG